MAPRLNPEALIESVPNFSEGVDAAKVAQIVSAMKLEGVRLLDWSMDAAHNRSVVTVAGPPSAVVEAVVRAVVKAAELINLTRQSGVHPRIGAADVVPFVPVAGVSLAECAMLARNAGLEIWRRAQVPVYFYEAAATRPDRINLEDVRRGQFEGLRDLAPKDVTRRPDVGGPQLHPTAGASAVGARQFLIAYNLYLAAAEPASHRPGILPQSAQAGISAARAIARAIRASAGGMHGVKAIGVMVNGRAQLSMNITDFRRTPVADIRAAIGELAKNHGTVITEGELIGLIPQEAYEPKAEWLREIPGFDPDSKVLERRLEHPLPWPGT
ncbi:MAG TPA: glutamate formimidoyltransferase [Acidobacteriaceae bacterium]|jgi:glutamate formiminotransferase|nr:glutamate formimidoyltransferase [Acidobacteriaceae bacterium]